MLCRYNDKEQLLLIQIFIVSSKKNPQIDADLTKSELGLGLFILLPYFSVAKHFFEKMIASTRLNFFRYVKIYCKRFYCIIVFKNISAGHDEWAMD